VALATGVGALIGPFLARRLASDDDRRYRLVGYCGILYGLGYAGFAVSPVLGIAGLAIVLLDKGSHDARESAAGMLAGSAGMIAYAAAVIPLSTLRALLAAASLGLTSAGATWLPPSKPHVSRVSTL